MISGTSGKVNRMTGSRSGTGTGVEVKLVSMGMSLLRYGDPFLFSLLLHPYSYSYSYFFSCTLYSRVFCVESFHSYTLLWSKLFGISDT